MPISFLSNAQDVLNNPQNIKCTYKKGSDKSFHFLQYLSVMQFIREVFASSLIKYFFFLPFLMKEINLHIHNPSHCSSFCMLVKFLLHTRRRGTQQYVTISGHIYPRLIKASCCLLSNIKQLCINLTQSTLC